MNSFNSTWEIVHQKQEWGKYPGEEIIRYVARNFYSKERSNVYLLDAGCGTGAVAWYMAREGFTVYAFDGSETAVSKANRRMREEGVIARISVSDAAQLPYRDEFFDGIVDSAMICSNTTDSIRLILEECYRVLKKGGSMFSTGLFKPETAGYSTGEKLDENTYKGLTMGNLSNEGTVHIFTYEEIVALWSDAGFINLKVDSLERTEGNGTKKISYFMVEASK